MQDSDEVWGAPDLSGYVYLSSVDMMTVSQNEPAR